MEFFFFFLVSERTRKKSTSPQTGAHQPQTIPRDEIGLPVVWAGDWHEGIASEMRPCCDIVLQRFGSMNSLLDLVLCLIFSYWSAFEKISKVGRVCRRCRSVVVGTEHFEDFLNEVKYLNVHERGFNDQIARICKLVHVNPATSSTGERSFSTARRVKSWLRSQMYLDRFTHLSIPAINNHKTRLDDICLVPLSVDNAFVSLNERWPGFPLTIILRHVERYVLP